MLDYTEEKKVFIDGIPLKYVCHMQETEQPGIVFPAHYHDYIEILYGHRGSFRVYLGSGSHPFGAGDMVLIHSKEVHLIEALSCDGGSYSVIRFDPDLIYNSLSQSHFELQYVLPFMLEHSGQKKVIEKQEIENTFIPSLMKETFEESKTRNYGYELAIKNNIGRLFLWILRYWHQSGMKPEIQSSAFQNLIRQMQPAFAYVLSHYETDIKASQMAKLSNMSYSYFSRTFNQIMNMSFSEYVNYIRIQEAEKLLISTSLTITEIGTAVGFSTSSYFIKQFQKYKNISPKQFRKNLTLNQPVDCFFPAHI